MKYNCPAQQLDVYDKTLKCFIKGTVCEYKNKYNCPDYTLRIVNRNQQPSGIEVKIQTK